MSGLALDSYPFPIMELQEVAPGSPALVSRLTLCWVFILPPHSPKSSKPWLCFSMPFLKEPGQRLFHPMR